MASINGAGSAILHPLGVPGRWRNLERHGIVDRHFLEGLQLPSQLAKLELQQPAASVFRAPRDDPTVQQGGNVIAPLQFDFALASLRLLQQRQKSLATGGIQPAHLGQVETKMRVLRECLAHRFETRVVVAAIRP
jgi:hypothetical protein